MEHLWSNAECIEAKTQEQKINQDKDKEQDLMRLHRSNGHEQRKDKVASKGKTELLAIYSGRQLWTEYAHFNHPATCYGEPEEGVSTKRRHPKGVVMLCILNAGKQLCEGTEENSPGDDKAQALSEAKLLGRSHKRDNSQAKQTDRTRIGRYDFYVGMRFVLHKKIQASNNVQIRVNLPMPESH